MAPTAVRVALVEGGIEGDGPDGAIVEEDSFRIVADSPAASAPDQVISAILGTREGTLEAGLRLSAIGVTWIDRVQAAALREALAAHKVENVVLVSAFLAAAALGQAVGAAVGYERTAVLYIDPESATLAVVNAADGSIRDLRCQLLADDDDAAVAELVAMVSAAESLEAHPDGVYVVGSGVDIAMIKPALDAATSLTVNASEEPEMALARGAALASRNAPLFDSSTVDSSTVTAAAPAALSEHLRASDASAEDDLAYSAVPDDADPDLLDADQQRSRPVLLIGSGLAVVVIAAVVALEIALAINIRPTVALQPTPNENHFIAPTQQAPALPEVAAPAPKLQVPKPPVAGQIPAPLPAAPKLPAPAAPAIPDPDVVVPQVPIAVPPVRAPSLDTLIQPRVPRVPVQVVPKAPAVVQPRIEVPVSPPRIGGRLPRSPVRELLPGLGPSPRHRGGGQGGLFGGGGPFGGGRHGGGFGSGQFGGGGHRGGFGGGGHGGGHGGGGHGGGGHR